MATTTRLVGVTAAGGATGQAVIGALARAGLRSRAIARSDASAAAARDAGADEVRRADLGRARSLADAVDGLDALVVIAPAFTATEEHVVADALAAATTAGVGHVVYYTVLDAHLPGVPHHLRKLRSERLVRDSQSPWTIVKPTMYQQTLLGSVRAASDGVVRVPWNLDAPFTLVDLADVAEVVETVVADPAAHASAAYELAGPQRLDTAQMVDVVAQATDTQLRAESLAPADAPLPPKLDRAEVAERMAMFAKYDRGYVGNPTVLRLLLGRDPTPLAATARRELVGEDARAARS